MARDIHALVAERDELRAEVERLRERLTTHGADLRDANLYGADDPSSPLHPIRLDMWSILDAAPAEVAGLRAALTEGRVDGSVYGGECACLVGTLAAVRAGHPLDDAEAVLAGVVRNPSRPAERWFMPIREGDRADQQPAEDESVGVFRARLAVQWVDEWRESRMALVAALGEHPAWHQELQGVIPTSTGSERP